MLISRLSAKLLGRLEDRRNSGLLSQEPPRSARRPDLSILIAVLDFGLSCLFKHHSQTLPAISNGPSARFHADKGPPRWCHLFHFRRYCTAPSPTEAPMGTY